MKLGWIAAVAAAVVLGGCTDADWNNAMSYVGLGNAAQSRPAAAPAQTAAAAEPAQASPAEPSGQQSWCQAVAKSTAETAASQGFDAATQKNRAEVMYRQCMESADSVVH